MSLDEFVERRIYKLALEVQDACNFGAVVRSFGKDIIPSIQHLTGSDTKAVMAHPVTVLFMNKLLSMHDFEDFDAFSKAYDQCKQKGGDLNVD